MWVIWYGSWEIRTCENPEQSLQPPHSHFHKLKISFFHLPIKSFHFSLFVSRKLCRFPTLSSQFCQCRLATLAPFFLEQIKIRDCSSYFEGPMSRGLCYQLSQESVLKLQKVLCHCFVLVIILFSLVVFIVMPALWNVYIMCGYVYMVQLYFIIHLQTEGDIMVKNIHTFKEHHDKAILWWG